MTKLLIYNLLLLFFFSFSPLALTGQEFNIEFKDISPFFPNSKFLNKNDIKWGYLKVPEEWQKVPSQNEITLAVAILKSTSKNNNTKPVVIIDGGPGAGSIKDIGWWVRHPIRKTRDIILIDARGTGFSIPRLCPDLGEKFLQILAKNQTRENDEKEKTLAALSCKQKLISEGINISSYNSINMSKDLHALKEVLGYEKWNVYSVSYGTYVAQVYAALFPNDIEKLILDSPIANIADYYNKNTSNYMSSFKSLINACKKDPECNSDYPELEDTFYKVVDDLKRNPLTVEVEKSLIPTGKFTYNPEDFKIAIHQALYQKKLIEVIPLLINQFHKRNKDAASSLVAAFSNSLALDYGQYYAVSCNEAIPQNSFKKFQNDSQKYSNLNKGLSFYGSDFEVCNQWVPTDNTNDLYLTNKAKSIKTPTLIFTGNYDPITPAVNGILLSREIDDSYLIESSSGGHSTSFTQEGMKLTAVFLSTVNFENIINAYNEESKPKFVTGIAINEGISKIGKSLREFNPVFLGPIGLALVICLLSIIIYTVLVIRFKTNRQIRILSIVTATIGVAIIASLIKALEETAAKNVYILAFGIPEKWNFLIIMAYIFLALVITLIFFFVLQIKKIKNRSINFTVIFSNFLICAYFLYWGLISF